MCKSHKPAQSPNKFVYYQNKVNREETNFPNSMNKRWTKPVFSEGAQPIG